MNRPVHWHDPVVLLHIAAVTFVLAVVAPHTLRDRADEAPATVEASRAADRAQCRADHGPHAIATELPDGSHRCTDHRGRRLGDA